MGFAQGNGADALVDEESLPNQEEPLSNSNALEGVDVEANSSPPTFEELFQASAISHVTLSPMGKLVAYVRDRQLHVGNTEVGIYTIGRLSRNATITGLAWSAEDVIIIEDINNTTGIRRLHVFELGTNDGELSVLRKKNHEIDGYIHDRLINDPEHIVFAELREGAEGVVADLYRLNVFADAYPQTKRERRLVRNKHQFYYFVRDAAGEVTVAVAISESVPKIWHRTADWGKWELLWSAPNSSQFVPVGLSTDGKKLWALSNASTDKLAAIEFDMNSGQIDRVIYEHPRFDLRDILLSRSDKSPVGVTYSDQGLNRYHFFNEDRKSEFDRFQRAFPGQRIAVIGYSADQLSLLLHVSSAQNSGDVYMCDIRTSNCQFIESRHPWLKGKTFSETIALEISSTDDLKIDAFLTIPASRGGPIALLAMPHGGPIGISDNQYFSPDVQWLALNGYAVLQVNYRGSGGYGKEFRAAGLRQWGRGIEDDIEAAIEHAIDNYAVIDPKRIGIIGASYGGYSALMSAIRRPDLYRCAASFAGVSDLSLIFDRPDILTNDELSALLTEIVGDPNLDSEELERYSPVYRYAEISTPLFIAHGDRDNVVDIEHSWRMRMMLNLVDIEPEFLVLPGVGHAFQYVNQAEAFYGPLIKFLDENLKPEEKNSQ